jgi:hypothetical protein
MGATSEWPVSRPKCLIVSALVDEPYAASQDSSMSKAAACHGPGCRLYLQVYETSDAVHNPQGFGGEIVLQECCAPLGTTPRL